MNKKQIKHSIFYLWWVVLVSCQPQLPYQADIFYIASTEVMSSLDENGSETYNATLTQSEQELLQQEIDFVREQLGDSFNFFAPYYHQFTMNAILLSEDSFQRAFLIAQQNIQQRFEDYLLHDNHGRPFFLVGFSQGAMMIPSLLRNMSEKAYQRCLGAYMIGYRLTKDDLHEPRISLARGELEGKVVSFNSVTSTDKQWWFVSSDAATCINPLNWQTDATPAVLYYQGDSIRIVQDTVHHVLTCDLNADKYSIPGTERWWPHGCLHHWDILFYNQALHNNMLKRLHAYQREAE